MDIWEVWEKIWLAMGYLITVMVGQPHKIRDVAFGGRWLLEVLRARFPKVSRVVIDPTRPGLCRIALLWYACCGVFIGNADVLPMELSAGGAVILVVWLAMMPTYLIVAKRRGWTWLLGQS